MEIKFKLLFKKDKKLLFYDNFIIFVHSKMYFMKVVSIKTFGKNSVSSVLYWVFKLWFVLLVSYLGFYVVSVVFGHYKVVEFSGVTTYRFDVPLLEYDWLIRMDAKGVISFLFPFFKNGFLFFLLILIFKEFRKEQLLFTKKVIKYLKTFAIINISMPLVYVLFDVLMFNQLVFLNITGALPNLIIGLVTLFIIAVFKQGFQIQQENDLTI